ncbi:MAG: aminoglycoside phosphotransferase family protein [Oscillospiraceae bacterium]|nr:aminoglycoside phosphotransferase family protein [Oscillospiraceae bacterium]
MKPTGIDNLSTEDAAIILELAPMLDNRPQTFTYGDWNTGNLMLSPDGQIWVIDCGKICGDPWWEFWEISGDAELMPHYYTGLIQGYFGANPPQNISRCSLFIWQRVIGTGAMTQKPF